MFKWPPRRFWLWGCGAGCAGMVFCGAALASILVCCPTWALDLLTASHPDLSRLEVRRAVETDMGVDFPETVRWVGCRVEQWLDTGIFIRCEMPRREVGKLVPGKTLTWKSSGSQIHNLGASERWFNPDALTYYQYAEVQHHPVDNGFLSILYDDSTGDDAMTTVYLFWHNT